jgi:hypothetical protein
MPEQLDLFNVAAKEATTVRAAAQAELAEDLANEILRNPARFDPKRLEALGARGFLVLLAVVRQHDIRDVSPRRNAVTEPAVAHTGASTWWHLRKPEPNRWLRGLAAGVGPGLLIIAIGLAVAAFS